MDKFQVVITRAKALASGAYNYVKAGLLKVRGAATGAATKVSGSSAAVRVRAATQTTRGARLTAFLRTTFRRATRVFKWFVLAEVLFRVLFAPRASLRAVRDWRNHPRRAVSVLWSALMNTVTIYVIAVLWTYGLSLVIAALALIMIATILVDLFLTVNNPVYAETHMGSIFAPARTSVRLALAILVGIPLAIATYEPAFIRSFTTFSAPAPTVVVEDDERTVRITKVSVETVPESEEVFTGGATVAEPTRAMEIELVGDDFFASPKEEGMALAVRLIGQDGREAAVKYRKRMARDLRQTGLGAREVTFALQGFDEVMKSSEVTA